jgi:2-(3-amino-3-carboxypropyl)histidine synthase
VRNLGGPSPRMKTFRARRSQIPQHLIDNQQLQHDISLLPANYNFEIFKTIARIDADRAAVVALQFPEGKLQHAILPTSPS